MPDIPMIAGLYGWARGGNVLAPTRTLEEISQCLELEPTRRRDLLCLAGDEVSADELRCRGLRVVRVFSDAPPWVHRDAAHLMKHWMVLWAIRGYGECLWLDWDALLLRPLDEAFTRWCRSFSTPKFIFIGNYWATVNCGVYYVPGSWSHAMEQSFEFRNLVSEPNDELLWRNVLPHDVRERPEYWWGDRALNIWTEEDFSLISVETYWAHVRRLGWAPRLRAARLENQARTLIAPLSAEASNP